MFRSAGTPYLLDTIKTHPSSFYSKDTNLVELDAWCVNCLPVPYTYFTTHAPTHLHSYVVLSIHTLHINSHTILYSAHIQYVLRTPNLL